MLGKGVSAMPKVFEVGRRYEFAEIGLDPVTIMRKTEKSIWVKYYDGRTFMMRLRHDEYGNECFCDSKIPVRYRYENTCNAKWPVKE